MAVREAEMREGWYHHEQVACTTSTPAELPRDVLPHYRLTIKPQRSGKSGDAGPADDDAHDERVDEVCGLTMTVILAAALILLGTLYHASAVIRGVSKWHV